MLKGLFSAVYYALYRVGVAVFKPGQYGISVIPQFLLPHEIISFEFDIQN